jgi:hypothetical protein
MQRCVGKIVGSEHLHETVNDNWIIVVNFATSEYLVVKSTMFLHRKTHKYIWVLLLDGHTIRLIKS